VRNDKVKEMAMPGDGVSREDMFQAADHLLCDMVRDIAWSTREPKMIAIDFQDMRYILGGMNRGAVGVGSATGADRARLAAEHALASPLLKDTDLSSVRGALIELRASSNLEMREAKETLSILRNGLPDAFTIYDFFMDEDMQDELRVIVIFITPLDEVRRQEVESQ
jgi:cell division protein FtsZ